MSKPEVKHPPQTSESSKPKLHVPRVQKEREKLRGFEFIPITDILPLHPPGQPDTAPQTRLEALQEQVKLTDEMGRLVQSRIGAVFAEEIDRINREAVAGEDILRVAGVPLGQWCVDDTEAATILMNMEAPAPLLPEPMRPSSRPGTAVPPQVRTLAAHDLQIRDNDPTVPPKPTNFAARVNEELVRSVYECDSISIGYGRNFFPTRTRHMQIELQKEKENDKMKGKENGSTTEVLPLRHDVRSD